MTKRLLGPTVALLVMVLSFALHREPAARGEPSERPPVPGSRQYAQEKGPQLLAAERWAEAAEVYAFWDHDLDRAVQFAQEQPPGKGEAERDGYRFRLLNFYFAQADFSRIGWGSSAATIADCGEKYRELVQRTPPAGAAVLDFSHLDLLKDTSKRARENNGLTVQDKAGILAALKAKPESVPTAAALIIYLEARSYEDKAAWREAKDALKGRWGKLALARLTSALNDRCDADTAVAILQDAAELTSSREQKAYLLWSLAWSQQRRAKEAKGAKDEALATSARVYEKFPETRYAAESRVLAASALQESDPEKAVEFVRRLQKQGKAQRDGLARVLFQLATGYFQKKDYDTGIKLLLEVVNDYGDTATASRAMLGLAEVYHVQGNKAKVKEWLGRCAAFEKTEATARSIMDTDDTRAVAIQRLARFHEADGQWREALGWWEKWQPQSWCGTCAMQMWAEKQDHINRCQLQLGEHKKAAQFLLAALQREYEPRLALRTLQLYREAGQEADLLKMVEAIDNAQLAAWDEKGYFKNMNRDEVVKMLPTWPIRESLRITTLAEQKDVAALIAITQQAGSVNGPTFEDGGSDWRCKLAAEALANCGGKEVPALREAIEKGPTNQSWLIYALGKSPAPAALDALDDLSKKEKGGDCDNVAYAISLKGEAGKKLLSRIVERDDNGMRAAAKRWLEKPPIDAFSWPRPARGSLPTSPPKVEREK